VVVGAGPCGLAAAAALGRVGGPPLVLERAPVVGSSWRGRYDTLRLNTIRWMSHLPGYRMPRRHGDYPTRDQLIEYLEEYARRHALRIQFDTTVERIDRDGGGWRLATSSGPLAAARVVVATGYDRVPKMPDWPGRESFTGQLVHAGEYRSAAPYRGRDVLVVGAGNTGTEIAHYLLEGGATRVRVSMRTPPNISLRKWLAMPLNPSAVMLEQMPPKLADRLSQQTQRLIFGDLSPYGLPRAPQGMITTVLERGVAPAIDDGFVAALKQGRIELVPVVERFEGADVVLSGGLRIRPDAVIAATGYARGLEPLVGHLGVLRADGLPVAPAGQPNADTPGLYFIGYLPVPSGQLRQARIQAMRLARTVARERRRSGRA
jgi:putative flavoprotein involved in K+ transport